MDIRKRNGKSGMTLIEILVVIALLGVLAGVLVRSVSGSVDVGKIAAAKLFCDTTMKGAIEAYKLSHDGKYPSQLSDLEDFLGDAAPKDPWGNPYRYAIDPSNPNGCSVWVNYDDSKADEPKNTYDPKKTYWVGYGSKKGAVSPSEVVSSSSK